MRNGYDRIDKICRVKHNFEKIDTFYILFAAVEKKYLYNKIKFNPKVFNKLVNNFLSFALNEDIEDNNINKNLDKYIYRYIKKEKNREEIRLEDIYFILEKFSEYSGYNVHIYISLEIYIKLGYLHLSMHNGDITLDEEADRMLREYHLRIHKILPPEDNNDYYHYEEDDKAYKKYFGKYYYYKAYSENFNYLLEIMENEEMIKPLFKND
jgi:hypothetical protein